MSRRSKHRVGAMIVAGLTLTIGWGAKPVAAELIYGVSREHFLITWDSAQPNNLLNSLAIQGLQLNEVILGIDVRPATGQLYALGSTSRVYTIDPTSGLASQVGPGSFSPQLNGAAFGMDFNPVPDRIRVVSNTDQNLRLHPDTGAVAATDALLAYALGDTNFGAPPNVIASAYTNNFAGATSTTLYGIDAGLDVLVRQDPPNDGRLLTIGDLGIDVTDIGAFDISGQTGIAYAALFDTDLNRSMFGTINLLTGDATMFSEINGGTTITAMTVVPEPASLLLLGAGLLGLARHRRSSSR